ncbi:type VI secretion system membrane subunit TssM [Neisseria zalophi]|uniref:Type VI secretion system membrane subunit TssM n=1 Tax=Neisseria zalophi TaxID=640030 RepID=A0A5J6PUX0_9NEIS|nr:type VI secretion system membrane subunit TssM [Neisseria zalophi]QEY26156.1 type VI secretion system membrane subunit TssM [Neisseria zalophi]
MKKFFYFLGSRSLWVILGLIGLIVLVWFIGPLISIGDIRPLASKSVRLVVCIAIIAIWFIKAIFRQYRELRRNAALIKEIKAAQEPILKNSSDTSLMSRQFAEMDKVLKNAKFSKSKNSLLARFEDGQYLYQMPWYVVLGAAGSGKTTALKRSGLNFPLESTLGTSVSGLAGTRDCDWFLSDEIVFLDTAGRLSLHDNHSDKDSEDWEEFVSLLKRYRPKQPINGVLVTVGVDDLLGGKTNIVEMSVELRKRIHEMHNQLGIHFPVYLMITKLDLLNGFDKFFSNLNEEQRSQYFGISLSNVEGVETPIATASNSLSQIVDKLRSSTLGIINNLDSSEDKAAAFAFPEEFQRLNEAVLSLLKELSKSSKFEQPIVWRGVCFSSGTQTGQHFDSILDGFTNDFQLSKKYSDSERTASSNSEYSYFLNKLFSDVILNESDLAGENKSWFFRNQMLYWSGIAIIALIVIGGVMLMLNSYANNKSYLTQVGEQADQLGQKVKEYTDTADLLRAVTFANQVRDTTKSNDIKDLSSPPLTYRFGLYQGHHMEDVGESSYQRILQDNVMPLISYKLDELLRKTNGSDGINGYNALKAYLMMFNKEHFDAEFMQNWLMSNLSKEEAANMNDQQKKSVEQALRQILTKQSIISSVPYDEELVERRRQEVAQKDIVTMVFEGAINTIVKSDEKNITAVSFSSMGGVQSHLLFRRKSGRGLKEPINFIYTKEAYITKVLPAMVKSAEQFFNEDNWVLENYSSLRQDKASVLSDAQRLYFNNYIKAWNDYLADLSLVTPQSSRESIQIAKLLSEKNSPLDRIIRGISDNTTLTIGSQLSDKADSKITDWLNKVGLAKLLDSDDKNNIENGLSTLKQATPVDDAFADFHILVKTEQEQPPAINQVIDAINDLYVYLVAVNVAVEKGVDLPPDEPFVKYKAEVNRLPSPFRQMLDNFSGIVVNNTEKIVDEKLMSTLENQLTTVTNICQQMKEEGYPFETNSERNVSLKSFANILGPNGLYSNFTKLSDQAAVLARSDNLEDLMSKNTIFKERFSALEEVNSVRQAYFNKGQESAQFDFSAKVLILDPSVDNVSFSYDGKTYVYNHGPVNPMSFTWPSENGDALAKIEITSPEINSASISANGTWSIFKLLEKGKILRQTDNVTVVEYNIKDKNVVIELTSSSSKNPFDMNKLRSFQCV